MIGLDICLAPAKAVISQNPLENRTRATKASNGERFCIVLLCIICITCIVLLTNTESTNAQIRHAIQVSRFDKEICLTEPNIWNS